MMVSWMQAAAPVSVIRALGSTSATASDGWPVPPARSKMSIEPARNYHSSSAAQHSTDGVSCWCSAAQQRLHTRWPGLVLKWEAPSLACLQQAVDSTDAHGAHVVITSMIHCHLQRR